MNLKRIAWEIVKFKARYGRGQSWVSYFNPIFYMGALANYKYILEYPTAMYFLAVGYLITCYLLGTADELWGIWKLENIYHSKIINPFMEELDKKINSILEATK